MALTQAQITTAYQNVLQRSPSAGELNSFFSASQSGALTDSQVYTAIITSPEASAGTFSVVRFYQAAFGRVPDQGGLDQQVDTYNVNGNNLRAIGDGFTASTEFTNRYGTEPTVTVAYLQSLYVNVLGRTGSSAEIQGWLDAVATPGSGYSDRGDVLFGFAQSGEFIQNSNTGVINFLTGAAQGQGTYTGPLQVAGNTGINFSLTTGTDNFTGTSGNDTITAGALAPDGVAAANTLNALDNINGGAGNDTLVIDTSPDQNALTGTITNIENLVLVGSDTSINGNTAIAATPYSGSIKLQQTADTAVGLTNVTGQALILDRVVDNTVLTAAYAAAQTSTNLNATALIGTATFSVSGAGLKNATLNVDTTAAGEAVIVTDTGNTTTDVTINSTGASTVTATSSALANVVVNGAGAVNLTTTTAPTTSVNASGSTGGVTLATALATTATFTGGTGADSITTGASTKASTLGAGNDTVNLSVAALGAGGSIDGGIGTDLISLSAANAATASATATFAGTISNFERFGVGATGAVDTVINADNIDGITQIVSAGTATGTLTVNNLAANSTFESTAVQGDTVTLNLKDATGVSDVLNLKFSATDGFTNTAAIVAAGVENLTIVTDDTDTTAPTAVFTAPITATSATSVAVSGDVGINLTGLTATTLTSFDASGVTATGAVGAVTLTTGALANIATLTGGAGNDVINAGAATKAVTLNGGAGNDSLTGSTSVGSTINGGAGDDILVGGTGIDTINGDVGNDTITSGAGLDVVNFGTGNDTFIVTANANGNVYASITGAGSADKIDFVDGGGAATFVNTAITLAPTAAFADFLQAATAGGADRVSFFQFSGDTYLVQDVTAGATFTNGADQVVRLVGLIDLSTATIDAATTNVLTLA